MERNYLAENRRKSDRLKINLAAWYKVVGPVNRGKETEVEMLDLSQGGMAFLTRDNIPAKSTLLIKFVLFKVDRKGFLKLHGPVKLAGEVCSSRSSANNQRRLGVSFKEVCLDDKFQIRDFVDFTRSKIKG
ncbi:MAG: PilZ domain-containing protein [Candidatus Omnitrophota bacterium]